MRRFVSSNTSITKPQSCYLLVDIPSHRWYSCAAVKLLTPAVSYTLPVSSLFSVELGVKNCEMVARPHPGPLPEEREKHSPVLWLNNRAWLSCASETKDKEAGTAVVKSEFSSTVPTLTSSSGERAG